MNKLIDLVADIKQELNGSIIIEEKYPKSFIITNLSSDESNFLYNEILIYINEFIKNADKLRDEEINEFIKKSYIPDIKEKYSRLKDTHYERDQLFNELSESEREALDYEYSSVLNRKTYLKTITESKNIFNLDVSEFYKIRKRELELRKIIKDFSNLERLNFDPNFSIYCSLTNEEEEYKNINKYFSDFYKSKYLFIHNIIEPNEDRLSLYDFLKMNYESFSIEHQKVWSIICFDNPKIDFINFLDKTGKFVFDENFLIKNI